MNAPVATLPDHVRRRVEAHPAWYQTIDLAPGVATAGLVDLREVADLWPWPNLTGKRCLDVGAVDGFCAFALEERGAAEVVAVDTPRAVDPVPPIPGRSPVRLPTGAPGPPHGPGFRVAAQARGSDVIWHTLSPYDLAPDVVGTFDVVVAHGLLTTVRDPLRALAAIRSVTLGVLLSSEPIDLVPGGHLGLGGRGGDRWWRVGPAGHRRLLEAGGFRCERTGRPHVVPHAGAPTSIARRLVQRDRTEGVAHAAVVARPLADPPPASPR